MSEQNDIKPVDPDAEALAVLDHMSAAEAAQLLESAELFIATENIAKLQGRPLAPEEQSMVWIAYSMGRIAGMRATQPEAREQSAEG